MIVFNGFADCVTTNALSPDDAAHILQKDEVIRGQRLEPSDTGPLVIYDEDDVTVVGPCKFLPAVSTDR